MRDSAPFTGGEGPSRAEVRRRIDSLYNRAETDSGTYNATRAMNLGTSGARNPVAPAPGRGRGSSDPVLDNVARQWFDAARDKVGPTVAAALPADRLPDRTPLALPAFPAQRPETGPAVRELEASARPVLELTAGSTPAVPATPAELTAVTTEPATAPAELTAVLPELTAAPAELAPPAAQSVMFPTQLIPIPGDLASGPVTAPVSPAQPTAAPPAIAPERPPAASWETAAPAPLPRPASPAEPDRSSMRPAKERNQLKLTAARQLLARRVTQLAPPAPAPMPPMASMASMAPSILDIPSAPPALPTETSRSTAADPAPRQPEGQWLPQQPDGFGTAVYAAPGAPVGTSPAVTGPDTGVGTLPAVTAEPVTGIGHMSAPAYPGKAALALEFARAQIGRPCLSGAAGPEAYDCSSLTQAAWRAAGVALPRTSQEQAGSGTAIPLTDLRPGDLLFFYDDAGHVGLCTGNGLMIHAPGPGASIREESIFFAGPQAIRGAIRPA